MGYVPYLKIDTEIVDKLSFPYEACNYVYLSDTKGKQVGTVYKISSATYDKIWDIFRGDDQVSISKGDKVYVLPGHPLASTRVKEYLKTVGATMTKSLNAATIIAGCDDCAEQVGIYDSQAKYADLMFNIEETNKVVHNDDNALTNTFMSLNRDKDTSERMEEEFREDVPCIVSSKVTKKMGFNVNIQLDANEYYFITPAGMEIIYYVLAKGLKVLTAANVADKANSGLKLDEEDTYESIKQMLASADRRNHKLGADILIHCDLSGDTLYNLWRLAYNYNNEVRSLDNSKGLSYFMSRTNWYQLANLRPEDFIEYADSRDALTPIMVKDLIDGIYEEKLAASPVDPEANDEYSYRHDKFFECVDNGDHSYTIQLKEKWKQILKKEDANECARL